MKLFFLRRLGLRSGDLVLFAVLLSALLLSLIYSASLLRRPTSGSGVLARIEINGKLVRSILLDQVNKPYELTFYSGKNNSDFNIVEVEKGRIRVRAANCPQQVDVHAGWLSIPGQSAFCLPHRFSMRLEEVDGIAEIDAVVR